MENAIYWIMKNDRSNFQRTAGTGYTILGALLFFGTLGYCLDKKVDSGSLFLISGLILGVILGMYELGKGIFKK